jgi:hypothetical protein
MPDVMPCREYKRLRTEYEAALRLWGHVLLAQHAGRWVGDIEKVLVFRKLAADERDATNKRLEEHKRSCPVCREAIRQLQNPHKKINRRNLEVRQLGLRDSVDQRSQCGPATDANNGPPWEVAIFVLLPEG